MEFNVEMKYVLDTTWLLLSGILVMWMAAGFAMLEAGLTQAKNTVTILTKNITLYGFACLMYWVIGYNLMYGEGNAVFGLGLGMSGMTNSDHALMADFFFQVVFVATAASIVSGAVAERMKFWAFIVFTVVLTAIIYPLQGHWTWGGSALGGLLDGFTDFAGSTIVHSVGGWAALAGVLLLGARRGKFPEKGGIRPIPGSNMPLATLGTFILWLGWFGFNGGSQLALGSKADVDAVATVIVNTNMAACAGALAALILTQLIYKKIDLSMVLNGALSGLVSITAGPDYPSVAVTLLIGAVAGMIVVFAVPMFDRLRIDDPVGALSVHLVNGIWGTLAVGIFNPEVSFLTQLLGVVVIGGFTFVSSLAVWFVIRKAMGLRVSEQEEIEGIDLHEFGMEAYPEFRPGFLPG
ncbi:MAG: ammonium transporter [SAR324 cluster bacterium]|nr:ammonium transporter [SAR324 cluster bacterium]